MKHGEFYHSDSIQFPDSLKYSTLLSGRTVYGGGGIMPDIFMPVDTTFATKLYTDLIRKGIFNRFTVDYVMKNRELISNEYSDFENFYKKFEVTDEMISDFRSLAEEEGVEWNDEQFQRSEPMIKLQLKALVARNEWSQSEYYRVVMNEDKAIKKAVEILNDSNQYRKILKR